eukprot:gb/GEZN01012681.1/.p1 GENE.gb/GEZN01012681.1/~~gb/GEZN01012681.1/.p1  ORF type:complete len:284 (-),score=20.17 gb/GEZN01012681.1/:124-975(-)
MSFVALLILLFELAMVAADRSDSGSILPTPGGRKYFLIGMNKAGTTSFHDLCEQNNLRADHNDRWWYWDPDNATHREVYFSKYDCFSDGYEGHEYHHRHTGKFPSPLTYPNVKALYRQYPDGIFFLNTRRLRDWMLSRFCGRDSGGLHVYTNGYEVSKEITSEIICDWVDRRNTLYTRVNDFFLSEGDISQLVVFSIDDTRALRPYFNRSTAMGHENKARHDNKAFDMKACFAAGRQAVEYVLRRCVQPLDHISLGVAPLRCTCSTLKDHPPELEHIDPLYRG